MDTISAHARVAPTIKNANKQVIIFTIFFKEITTLINSLKVSLSKYYPQSLLQNPYRELL